jgi:hypothetical protein
MEVIAVSRGSDGNREPQQESGTPQPKPVRPEDVRVSLDRSGQGSEGVFPGPRQSAVLRERFKIRKLKRVKPGNRAEGLVGPQAKEALRKQRKPKA